MLLGNHWKTEIVYRYKTTKQLFISRKQILRKAVRTSKTLLENSPNIKKVLNINIKDFSSVAIGSPGVFCTQLWSRTAQ